MNTTKIGLIAIDIAALMMALTGVSIALLGQTVLLKASGAYVTVLGTLMATINFQLKNHIRFNLIYERLDKLEAV